jgi:hypothetical protein
VIAIALPEIELSMAYAVRASNRGVFGWPVFRWSALAAGVVILASVGVVVVQRQHSISNAALVQRNTDVPETVQPPLQSSADNSGSVVEQNHKKHNVSGAPDKRQDESELTAKNLPPSLVHNHSRFQRNGPDSNSEVANTKDAGTQSISLASPPAARIPRWTIASSGALQRSMDAGKNWEDVNPGLDAALPGGTNSQFNFLVVASKGLEVWAACSGGSLFASTDGGNRWSLITPSNDDVKLTGDITHIELTDQFEKVTTSTGELWVSSDDGVNWQKWH